MKPHEFILVALVLIAGCKRPSDLATSFDQVMQQKLAGVWVRNRTLKSGGEIVSTLEMTRDGAYTGIKTFSKPTPDGLSRIEARGRWRIEDGFLIMTLTTTSLTNAGVSEKSRLRIVRLDDHELEYEPPEEADGSSVPTNHIVFRRQTR
jgi:hypothetical protein